MKIINLALRAFEFFWTLLIMALVGNMIASAFSGNPSIVNYDMFIAVITMLALFYLIAVDFNEGFAGHPALPLALDLILTLFWFCGAVAMAAELRVHSCGNVGYIKSNHITNGAANMTKRCHEAQATTAFLWFGFACFVASTVLSAFGARGGGVNLRSGGIRKGGPAMSQV